ncbi:MAG TPA: hypothetical protein VFE26_10865 [Trebonia sp.]|jgi:hypothetical protein|nr:hypothetical protein [Trebonia sp.]
MAAKRSSNGAPAGYRKVETRITGFFKPDKAGEYIEGVVGHRAESPGSDGKPNVYYTFRCADDQCTGVKDADNKAMRTEGGQLIGVGGKTLLTFLEEHEGQAVYIVYKGLGKAKKGQNAPKTYDTYEKGEGDA